MAFKRQLRNYYILSKPGIIYANILTALAGFLFASKFQGAPSTLLGLIGGLTLVIAGACAYNNYLDRGIDSHMSRTKRRSLVTGDLSNKQALVFATAVTLLGALLLLLTQNAVTVLLAAIAFVDYVVVYGWSKRKSVHGTLVGCVSGAIPLVAGYTAVTGSFDVTAGLLFALMVAWQMVHFYGIALYRLEDYMAAGIPVMPAVHGAKTTQYQSVAYIIMFLLISLLLVARGDVGAIAGGALTVLAAVWLYRALRSYSLVTATVWGKQTFIFSLNVMLAMSVLLSVGRLVA